MPLKDFCEKLNKLVEHEVFTLDREDTKKLADEFFDIAQEMLTQSARLTLASMAACFGSPVQTTESYNAAKDVFVKAAHATIASFKKEV